MVAGYLLWARNVATRPRERYRRRSGAAVVHLPGEHLLLQVLLELVELLAERVRVVHLANLLELARGRTE